MRPGATLPELVVVCTLVAIAAGVAAPRGRAVLDGLRLRQAAHEVSGAATLARAAALRRGDRARLIVDRARGAITVESMGDTLFRRNLRKLHRVSIHASRDTVTYAPSGLGFGASNSTIVLSIGARAETVTVSRLGRVRASF